MLLRCANTSEVKKPQLCQVYVYLSPGFPSPATNHIRNLRTYSDILRLIISLKKAGFNVDCSVTPDKETRRTKVNIAVENPNLSSMLSKWNELNDDLEKDKIDSDEYNIWIEDLMTSFNYPIEII